MISLKSKEVTIRQMDWTKPFMDMIYLMKNLLLKEHSQELLKCKLKIISNQNLISRNNSKLNKSDSSVYLIKPI